jgi:hypothetical protein
MVVQSVVVNVPIAVAAKQAATFSYFSKDQRHPEGDLVLLTMEFEE